MSNLRDRQIALLNKILSIADSGSRNGADEYSDQWKVLIYDEDCRDLISPLMNVGSLRQKGVTLHLMIQSEREAIQDAPAVYFIRPTEINIRRVIEDCTKQMYRSFHLNFISRIERPLLEKFAQEIVANNTISSVSRIVDQYLDVIALEPSLFTLNINDSFNAYNETGLSESNIRSFMQRVSFGLLSMSRLLGSIPVIRSPHGGAAEMLAQSFAALLRENISPRGPASSLFADALVSDRPRPLLLIFDRNSDIFPLLQHTSTYQALVDDLLDHRLNRVTIETKDILKTKKKTYDLNTQADSFFGKYAGSPFPEAIEANEKELAEVSQKETDIKSKPITNLDAAKSFADTNEKELSEAIESLPEILNRKANLEAHTNILHAVMNKIAAREIPTYFELEQSIINNGRIVDKTPVLSLLKDSSKGKFQDKARLLLLIIVSGDTNVNLKGSFEAFDDAFVQGTQALMASDATACQQADIDLILAVATFLRRLQTLQTPLGQKMGVSQSSSSVATLLNTAQSRATSLMAKATSLFSKFNAMYVTRIVELLSEGRSCAEDDSFTYFDPKQSDQDVSASKVSTKYSEVIVFVVGGGCYSEFYNLQDLLKQKQQAGSSLKNIIYGCSELLSGDRFLDQIGKLVK